MQQKRETEQQQNQDEVRDNIADNASGIRSESKPNETKVISLFDKLKRCFSKKQTKGDNQVNYFLLHVSITVVLYITIITVSDIL